MVLKKGDDISTVISRIFLANSVESLPPSFFPDRFMHDPSVFWVRAEGGREGGRHRRGESMTGGGGLRRGEREKGGGGRVNRGWEIILGHLLQQIFLNKNLPKYFFPRGT